MVRGGVAVVGSTGAGSARAGSESAGSADGSGAGMVDRGYVLVVGVPVGSHPGRRRPRAADKDSREPRSQ